LISGLSVTSIWSGGLRIGGGNLGDTSIGCDDLGNDDLWSNLSGGSSRGPFSGLTFRDPNRVKEWVHGVVGVDVVRVERPPKWSHWDSSGSDVSWILSSSLIGGGIAGVLLVLIGGGRFFDLILTLSIVSTLDGIWIVGISFSFVTLTF
jgi:hypothetical protein